ncbi:hypothetical protein [Streptomyces sp. NRRL S-87]|uniref:hypothetical protein n=1 Tax=Streptomyces sp. NRRL S-87 TaxID=1463920 RepID=UPI00068FF787|nr:hypothetical protein [Streptomyces sp. NRRL S-87]
MNASKPAALTALPAAVLAAGAYLLLMPWDPRAEVPAGPGAITLTSGHTVWGVALFALVLAVLAAAVGRFTARPAAAMAGVGGTPAALLLASYLTHRPAPDGFAGLWSVDWLFTAALMVAGTGLVAYLARRDRTPELMLSGFRDALLPVAAVAAAGLAAFFAQAVAEHGAAAARTAAAVLALALGHGLGWALRAAGRRATSTAALAGGGVVLIAAVDSAAVPLWGWTAPDLLAWAVAGGAFVLGAALAHAVHPARPATPH